MIKPKTNTSRYLANINMQIVMQISYYTCTIFCLLKLFCWKVKLQLEKFNLETCLHIFCIHEHQTKGHNNWTLNYFAHDSTASCEHFVIKKFCYVRVSILSCRLRNLYKFQLSGLRITRFVHTGLLVIRIYPTFLLNFVAYNWR